MMKIKESTNDSSFRTASGFQEFIKDGKTSLTENNTDKKIKVYLKKIKK